MRNFDVGLQSDQSGRAKEPKAGLGAFKRSGHFFYDVGEDFRQRSEAVGLLQASYMLRQLTGKMSAHYSSSKIRNTHFRLFPPDQGPHTVQIVRFLETLQTGYSPFLNLKCCFCKCSIELLFIFLFPYYWPFNNPAVRSLFSVVCLRRLYSR